MSDRTAVLHLRASRFVGGPERQLLHYADLDKTSPYRTFIGSFVGDGEGTQLLAAAAELGIATTRFSSNPWKAVGELSRFLRENQISIVTTHGYKADIVAALACHGTVPIAVFLRGWTGENVTVRMYELAARVSHRAAARIVCLSPALATSVRKASGPADKVRVVPNAAGPLALSQEERALLRDDLRSMLQIPANAVLIGSAGRLSPEKGVEVFLRAILQIHEAIPNSFFVVCGSGVQELQLRKQAAELKIEAFLRFTGFLEPFPRSVAGFDILVNPSLTEGIPNVVLEALSAGVPVVATAVGGVPDLAYCSEMITLVPASDPDAIASATIRVHRQPRRQRVALAPSFTWAEQEDALLRLYDEILGRPYPLKAAPLQGFDRDALPLISVVIPVRNEGHHIGSVLKDLMSQDYPSQQFEILVADGESTDNTRAVVDELAKTSAVPIRLLPNPYRLSSAGRNVGVRMAKGEVIVFVDGHCAIRNRRMLRDISGILQVTLADCLSRPQPLESKTFLGRVIAVVRAHRLGHGPGSNIYFSSESYVDPTSSGAIYRREVFDRIGLYDEQFDACEDVEFNHRVKQAGMLSYTSERLSVAYEARTSFRGLWKQLSRYGQGRRRLVRKHPDAGSLAQLIPALFVLGIVLTIAAASAVPATRWLAAAGAASYLLAIVCASAAIGYREGFFVGVVSPIVFSIIHLSLGFGWWAEVLSGPPMADPNITDDEKRRTKVHNRRRAAGAN